jgi:hypothetical protein
VPRFILPERLRLPTEIPPAEIPPAAPPAGAAGAAAPEQAPGAARGRAIPLAAWIVHLAWLAVAGAYILRLDRHMTFFYDEWDFIQDRGLSHSLYSLWAPHNEHWVTLPVLAYRALLTVFGMRSYLPFIGLLIALHLILTHVLWRMCLRVGARPLIATVLTGVFAVFGAGSQNLVWAFQITFVGAVLFGWLWLWATDHDGGFGRRDAAGWALGVAALMCSAIGVPMLMVTAIAVTLRRGWRAAAAAVSVPAAAFAAWYLLAGRVAQRTSPISKSTLVQIGTYTWDGISTALSGAVGFAGAGAVLAVVLVYALLRRPSVPRDAIARAGAAGVVLSFAFIAIGRSGLGVTQSDRTRYAYVAIALLLPAAALLLSALFRPAAGPVLVFGLLAGLVLVVNVAALRAAAQFYTRGASADRQQILAAYDLVNRPGFVFAGAPTAVYSGPQPSVAGLRQIRRSGWLAPFYPVLPRYVLGARVRLETGLLPAGTAGPATVPAAVTATGGLSVAPAGPGCLALTPASAPADSRLILAPSGRPLLLTVTRAGAGQLTGSLSLPGNSAVVRHLVPIRLAPGSSRVLLAPDAKASLTLPGGTTRVCGLTPASAASAAPAVRTARTARPAR